MNTNKFLLFAALLGTVCTSARGQDETDTQVVLVYSKVDDYAAVKSASNSSYVGEVVIPDSVTIDGEKLAVKQIAKYAFNDKNVIHPTKVTIQGKDVEIADYAFLSCTTLVAVEVTGSIKSIGFATFNGCTSLESIDLVEGLESIGERGFSGCTSLKEATIPKSVTSLGIGCFESCYNLEKVYIEGGGLTDIPKDAFYSRNVKELSIPEGVETIGSEAFAYSSKLETLTLPKTLTSLYLNAVSECDALTTVKLYASSLPETTGEGTCSATLYVPNPSDYANWANYFTGGIEQVFTFTPTDDGGISATDSESFLDAFRAISDSTGTYANANVNLASDIVFNAIEFGKDTVSASNIYTLLDAFPTAGSYDGKFNGSTISNMTMRSTGLFGTLGDSAKVNNLVLQDATLYVDPTDSETYEVDGDDVTVHILAKTNNGAVTNFGFSGDIIVDEDLAAGKEISVCAVNEMGDSATISGFVYINSLLTTGNTKRCITIKQNLGIKRPPGKKTKVATNKSLSSNKSLTDFDFDNKELLESVCAFTDEEFESGVVAYWLNYSGPGFTGDYTGYWAQGKKIPVPATSTDGVSNALQKVDYGTTDLTHITSAPLFANNGSEITIAYDEQPASVTIGGEEFKTFGATSMTVTFDSAKPIVLAFNKAATDLDQAKEAQISVSTSGLGITVTGAPAGSDIKLYSLTGKLVAATNGTQLTAPAQGIYVLKVSGKTYKVALK